MIFRPSFGLPYVLFVFWLIVIFVISQFGLEGGTLVLIASVPGQCLCFTFYLLHAITGSFMIRSLYVLFL